MQYLLKTFYYTYNEKSVFSFDLRIKILIFRVDKENAFESYEKDFSKSEILLFKVCCYGGIMDNYKNKELSAKDRAKDLLSKMTLDEKVAQLRGILPNFVCNFFGDFSEEMAEKQIKNGIGRVMQGGMLSMFDSKKIPKAYNDLQRYLVEKTRLGIPAFTTIEVNNGQVLQGGAQYPQPIERAATFDEEINYEIGKEIGKEMNACGMTIGLSPVMDLARDVRWGRTSETLGEDRYLSAKMGASLVKGMQESEKVLSCGKHFVGYSTTVGGINCASVAITDRELYEDYCYPFEACFRNGMTNIMDTYSAINERPVSVNKAILTDLLREKLGFDGVAVSDGGAVERVRDVQKIGRDYADVAALAIKAGLNSDNPTGEAFKSIPEAITRGILTEEDVDKAVMPVLEMKFSSGLFDNPYVDEEKFLKAVNTEKAKEIGQKAAEEGIVLLKNDGILPLKNVKRILIVGADDDKLKRDYGCYTYSGCMDMMEEIIKGGHGAMQGVADNVEKSDGNLAKEVFNKNPEDAMKMAELIASPDIAETVTKSVYGGKSREETLREITGAECEYVRVCDYNERYPDALLTAVEKAKNADVVLCLFGDRSNWVSDGTSGEDKDSCKAELTKPQIEALEKLSAANGNIVLALIHGRTLALPKNVTEMPRAILDMFAPCEQNKAALANILIGKVNPSGKLPYTVPQYVGQTPLYYSQIYGNGTYKGAGVLGGDVYVDCDGKPAYPFGYGLSYSKFEYSDLEVENFETDGKAVVSFKVKNISDVAGKEAVQLYFGLKERLISLPIKRLVGYKKLELLKNEQKTVAFEIDSELLAYVDFDNELVIDSGKVEFSVDGSSDTTLSKTVEIKGDKKVFEKRNNFFSTVTVK